ncbi:hypothetical protein BOO69_00190 [Sulfitobacter alexandrii]|uniref:Uncharacterized protein n=1 Tax=Sulfitobacter alexandrii TaxID=1917485 RepID=A0A1J0WCG4_9RHOB|nr:hypothetical protein [Sulfitobacter alexandrii]APE42002.1 hypothetical protein BOO69_00190 [Sulfitobacter alexandrii]
MLRNISILAVCAAILVACGGGDGIANGLALLGGDFNRAFQQNPNDTPISLDNIALVLTPEREPFNP